MISSYPGSPFYDPSSQYPGYENVPGWQDDSGTLGYQLGEDNQGASWTQRLAGMGFGGTDAKSQFANSLFGKFKSGYEAENMSAPGLYWQEYLKKALGGGKLDEMWKQQSPVGRGENIANWAPNSRWLRRS